VLEPSSDPQGSASAPAPAPAPASEREPDEPDDVDLGAGSADPHARLRGKIARGTQVWLPLHGALTAPLLGVLCERHLGVSLSTMRVRAVVVDAHGATRSHEVYADRAVAEALAQVTAAVMPELGGDHPLAPAGLTLAMVAMAVAGAAFERRATAPREAEAA
jgi:hypothetical protein